MHSNWENIGNNLPPGFNDMGEPYYSFGLSSRYNQRIKKWEDENKSELEELETAVIKYYKYPENIYDEVFQKRFEELKTKFPAQYKFFAKKHWK